MSKGKQGPCRSSEWQGGSLQGGQVGYLCAPFPSPKTGGELQKSSSYSLTCKNNPEGSFSSWRPGWGLLGRMSLFPSSVPLLTERQPVPSRVRSGKSNHWINIGFAQQNSMNQKGSETGKALYDSKSSVCTSKHVTDEPTCFPRGKGGDGENLTGVPMGWLEALTLTPTSHLHTKKLQLF